MGLGGDNGPFVELRDSLKETGDVGGSEVCFRVDRVSYTHMHTHTQGRERETEGKRESKGERERWRDRDTGRETEREYPYLHSEHLSGPPSSISDIQEDPHFPGSLIPRCALAWTQLELVDSPGTPSEPEGSEL